MVYLFYMLIKHLGYCPKEIGGIKTYGSFVLTGRYYERVYRFYQRFRSVFQTISWSFSKASINEEESSAVWVHRAWYFIIHTHTYVFVCMSGRAMETGVYSRFLDLNPVYTRRILSKLRGSRDAKRKSSILR